jgi:subtilisin family serine protease
MRRTNLLRLCLGVSAAAFLAVTAAASTVGAGPGPGADPLSKHERQLIVEARTSGNQQVTLLIAAKGGAGQTVADEVRNLGGTVEYRDTALGYLRVDVPASKAEAAASISAIEAVDVDEIIPLEDPRPVAQEPVAPQPTPTAATPAVNDYLPTGDTGAPQFVAANPQYDGRGVRIGILDTGVDLLAPELQWATKDDGTRIRKIVDWVTFTHPVSDNDPTWVRMATQVKADDGTFKVGNDTYTTPRGYDDSDLRFGLFNERDPRLGGELGNDVNRDGNPQGSSGLFAIVWDGGDKVWVDANQNRSFADENMMERYSKNGDYGLFGTDNPATAVRETVPFVVQPDKERGYVNIGIVSGAHGTHVAGIAAGRDFFGEGGFDGAAPGAEIVSVRVCLFIAGCTAHALVEGMIWVIKEAKSDVVNMSIGGLPALNDGNNARAEIYNRLIQEYKVQMFISAGNSGSGSNTVGDPSVATDVMSVGSYITDDGWETNYGSSSPFEHNLHPFSSRGPREDGGFKPQIVAPGHAVSTIPAWQNPAGQCLSYTCPPGYGMFNGTSMAAPQAAGAAALLISAAKKEAEWRPEQIRQAMNSSALYLPGYAAHEQGNGLLQVGAAWEILKQKPVTGVFTSTAPVNTDISEFLATPNTGVGIHEREGWTAGESETRTITLRRLTGGKSDRYNLSWQGNDGTFSTSVTSANLKRGASVPVTVSPATPGIHSAILNVDDPATPGVDYQVMNTVVAAEEFTAASDYTVTKTGLIGRNQALRHFYRVPAATPAVPAFKVDFSGPSTTAGTGQARFLRYTPWGLPFESNASTQCWSPPRTPGGACAAGNPNSRAVTNPQTGVWENAVEGFRQSDAAFAPFSLTAQILGASVSPNPDVIASATVGVPINRSYELKSLYATFTGRAVGTDLGSARRGPFTIGHHEVQEYPITLPAGTTRLRATIGSPSDPAADLDLFVFQCTTGTCVRRGASADGDSEESVTITTNLAAGPWLVVVDGFDVPAGTTSYNYVDVFTKTPSFGSVSVTDANASRPSGSAWTVPGTVTANEAPASGRVLLGNVEARTDGNLLIGSGDVVVQSVVSP